MPPKVIEHPEAFSKRDREIVDEETFRINNDKSVVIKMCILLQESAIATRIRVYRPSYVLVVAHKIHIY